MRWRNRYSLVPDKQRTSPPSLANGYAVLQSLRSLRPLRGDFGSEPLVTLKVSGTRGFQINKFVFPGDSHRG